ncbi:hypothetical protein G7046_g5123 [Stylonectria norvegica]|nr:hypothetical protein G7046_g5123 [Stylonectria norvegica]
MTKRKKKKKNKNKNKENKSESGGGTVKREKKGVEGQNTQPPSHTHQHQPSTGNIPTLNLHLPTVPGLVPKPSLSLIFRPGFSIIQLDRRRPGPPIVAFPSRNSGVAALLELVPGGLWHATPPWLLEEKNNKDRGAATRDKSPRSI